MPMVSVPPLPSGLSELISRAEIEGAEGGGAGKYREDDIDDPMELTIYLPDR